MRPASNEDGAPGLDDYPDPDGSDNDGDTWQEHPEGKVRVNAVTVSHAKTHGVKVSHAKHRRDPRRLRSEHAA